MESPYATFYYNTNLILSRTISEISHIIGEILAVDTGWWRGVVVSALASINEVNLRRARLVLRWATVSEFNSLPSAVHLFRYVTN